MTDNPNAAVVLLSGGQDSTTCFYYALRNYSHVEAVSFDYGQRHKIELDLAAETAAKNDVTHTVLPVEALKALGAASLTNPDIENTPGGATAPDGWHARNNLPPSFVPGRNLLFFTLAAAYGIPKGIKTIVTGVCSTDSAGYPDCRPNFVRAMGEAIATGMSQPEFMVDAPLMYLTKAATFDLADELGVLNEILTDTNTCYEGVHAKAHGMEREVPKVWGYGCGVCGACVERAKGYEEFRQAQGKAAGPH